MNKILMIIYAALLVLFAPISKADDSQEVEQLKARLLNREGNASDDRRVDEHALDSPLGAGPKTGCHGDTVVAHVKIVGVDVSKDSPTRYAIVIAYSGEYTRQGWISPCIQDPKAREDHVLSGKATFQITQEFLKAPAVVFISLDSIGDVADASHDSNILALRALQQAVAGAF